MFSGRRRNSPCADALCTDLTSTALPSALFIADEAEVTVTVEDRDGLPVGRCLARALIGVGVDDTFAVAIHLIGDVPSLGLVEAVHQVDLTGTVGAAVDGCATQFAVAIADRLADISQPARLEVVGHSGGLLVGATC
ncbi:hypothetical protein [Prescottella subtropica]|uniref:hypothetical protein n=1 Tax=Prescottella subtropica TaxID=2545757 RepID=UPI0010F6B6DE|nr:hypothetical protein [Prescottella subtropica]